MIDPQTPRLQRNRRHTDRICAVMRRRLRRDRRTPHFLPIRTGSQPVRGECIGLVELRWDRDPAVRVDVSPSVAHQDRAHAESERLRLVEALLDRHPAGNIDVPPLAADLDGEQGPDPWGSAGGSPLTAAGAAVVDLACMKNGAISMETASRSPLAASDTVLSMRAEATLDASAAATGAWPGIMAASAYELASADAPAACSLARPAYQPGGGARPHPPPGEESARVLQPGDAQGGPFTASSEQPRDDATSDRERSFEIAAHDRLRAVRR